MTRSSGRGRPGSYQGRDYSRLSSSLDPSEEADYERNARGEPGVRRPDEPGYFGERDYERSYRAGHYPSRGQYPSRTGERPRPRPGARRGYSLYGEDETSLFPHTASPPYWMTGSYRSGGATYGGGSVRGLPDESSGYGSLEDDALEEADLFGREGGQIGYGPHWPQQRHSPGAARRGPKNYRRADERIREDIAEQLIRRGDVDASEVSVQVQAGTVSLEGEVPERYMKYAIEDLAAACAGVEEVENRIRVARPA